MKSKFNKNHLRAIIRESIREIIVESITDCEKWYSAVPALYQQFINQCCDRERGCDKTGDPCFSLAASSSPSIGTTDPCECCEYGTRFTTGELNCIEQPTGKCWGCRQAGTGCQQLDLIPMPVPVWQSTIGNPLYPDQPSCQAAVTTGEACGGRGGEPCEGWPSTWAALTPAQQGICHECPGHPDCHCCPDPTRGGGNDLNCTCCNGAYGQSYQIPSSTPGGCASLNSSTLYNCGPAGQHIDCKKPGGGEPVGTSIGESKKLRQEIQKELFGKK